MAYLGQQPISGDFKKLDTISVVNGQAAYTMQYNSANYVPASANHMIVSLNGIIQNPGTSFTVSGSTITFASNLVTGDVINFILVLGDVLNIGTPSDNTVTNDKLATAPTLISKGGGGSSGGIKLNCEQNSHGVTLRGPSHSSSQNYTLTLPSTAPSANKALITDGSGNLSFGTAGGLSLLNKTTLSSSTDVQFQGLMTGYDSYKVVYSIQRSTNLIPRLYFMSGSTILSSNYDTTSITASGSVNLYQDDGQGYINMTGTYSNSYSTSPVQGFFYIINPSDSGDYTQVVGSNTFWESASNLVMHTFSASSNTAQAQDGIRFYPSTGTFSDGFIKLYGIS